MYGKRQAVRLVFVQRMDQRSTIANLIRVITGAFDKPVDMLFNGRMMRHRPGERSKFCRFKGKRPDSGAGLIPGPGEIRHFLLSTLYFSWVSNDQTLPPSLLNNRQRQPRRITR